MNDAHDDMSDVYSKCCISYPKNKPIRLKGKKLKELKEACIERDGFCLYSGSPFNLQAHHIKPLGRGGSDILENLATVTASVHDNIHKEWLNVSGTAPDKLTWIEKGGKRKGL